MISFSCLRLSTAKGTRQVFTLAVKTPQKKSELLKSKFALKEVVRWFSFSKVVQAEVTFWGPGHIGVPRFGSRLKHYHLHDHILLYAWIAAVPVALMGLYTLYIGPAELKDIPEGYEPRHWEYYRTPVQRFMHKWVYQSYEQVYERNLHLIDLKMRKADSKRKHATVIDHMKYNFRYKGWYYQIDRRLEDVLMYDELQKKHGQFREYFYGRPPMDRSNPSDRYTS